MYICICYMLFWCGCTALPCVAVTANRSSYMLFCGVGFGCAFGPQTFDLCFGIKTAGIKCKSQAADWSEVHTGTASMACYSLSVDPSEASLLFLSFPSFLLSLHFFKQILWWSLTNDFFSLFVNLDAPTSTVCLPHGWETSDTLLACEYVQAATCCQNTAIPVISCVYDLLCLYLSHFNWTHTNTHVHINSSDWWSCVIWI